MTIDWRLDDTMLFMSRKAWSAVPRSLQKGIEVDRYGSLDLPGEATPCLVVFASEVLGGTMPERLLAPDTRYAIIVDNVPLPTLVDIPILLNLHRPDLRVHWTGDFRIIQRAVISLLRDQRHEAILDAYLFEDRLTVVLADLKKREIDVAAIASLARIGRKELANLEVDADGSYLHWPSADIHLGVSQILQSIDPQYRAEIEMERNAADFAGWAIQAWRRELGLNQVEIKGLSERQVGRIERGISRLTATAAARFAHAFGLSMETFLNELAQRTRQTREAVEGTDAIEDERNYSIVVFETAA